MRACMLPRASAAIALSLLFGCAAFEHDKSQPREKLALVKAGQWGKAYRGGYVELASVNGVATGWRLRSDMEITPGILSGVYYVYLCAQGDKHCTSIAETQISFKAEAGRTYQVHAREQVNGTNRFWVWVEDAADGRVVGGKFPGTT